MEKYSGYELDRDLKKINKDKELYYELEFNYCKKIPFPANFFLIQSKYFEDFIYVYDEYHNKNYYNKNKYKGYFIKDYILLENNEDSDLKYIACSMKGNKLISFPADFIFFNSEKKEINFKIIKDFLENQNIDRYLINLINKEIKLNDNEDGGYVICFPSNELKRENIFDRKIYNKIKSYFSLNSKYKDFVSSINDIENNELNSINVNEIEKILLAQMKIMTESLVYILDENIFKEIRKKIHSDDYDIFKFGDKKSKEKLIIKIYKKEINSEEESKKYFFLSFDDLLIINDKGGKICLINEEIGKGLKNMINIEDLDDNNDINLLKINNEFYLYFNEDNKIVKIIKEEENIWSIDIKKDEYDYKAESIKK